MRLRDIKPGYYKYGENVHEIVRVEEIKGPDMVPHRVLFRRFGLDGTRTRRCHHSQIIAPVLLNERQLRLAKLVEELDRPEFAGPEPSNVPGPYA